MYIIGRNLKMLVFTYIFLTCIFFQYDTYRLENVYIHSAQTHFEGHVSQNGDMENFL